MNVIKKYENNYEKILKLTILPNMCYSNEKLSIFLVIFDIFSKNLNFSTDKMLLKCVIKIQICPQKMLF